jgi:hypothetical protein
VAQAVIVDQHRYELLEEERVPVDRGDEQVASRLGEVTAQQVGEQE